MKKKKCIYKCCRNSTQCFNWKGFFGNDSSGFFEESTSTPDILSPLDLLGSAAFRGVTNDDASGSSMVQSDLITTTQLDPEDTPCRKRNGHEYTALAVFAQVETHAR